MKLLKHAFLAPVIEYIENYNLLFAIASEINAKINKFPCILLDIVTGILSFLKIFSNYISLDASLNTY